MVPRRRGADGEAGWHDGRTMTMRAHASSWGFDFLLDLATTDLLPGRLVDGTLSLTSQDGGDIRGARVTLAGTERWRHDVTTTDADGHSRTETKTSEKDLPAVPVQVLGATTFAAGETRTVAFQLPVPGLGPPTFAATELAVAWEARVNVDVSGFDPRLIVPVRIHQPTALLRAGVVPVAEFALYPEADAAADGFAGAIRLEPSPLCIGAPFTGRLTLEAAPPRKVQEVRLELRVRAESTVSGGRDETITVWAGRIAGAGEFGGAQTIEFAGTLPDTWLPTMESEHGRSSAQFHVIVATAWAQDPHLVRDVTLCTTTVL
jgi:hypothetical protein